MPMPSLDAVQNGQIDRFCTSQMVDALQALSHQADQARTGSNAEYLHTNGQRQQGHFNGQQPASQVGERPERDEQLKQRGEDVRNHNYADDQQVGRQYGAL